MFNPKINISMKKTILSKILIISLVLIGAYSCAPKVAQETKKTSNNDLSDLPEWVLDPKIKDGVAAVVASL
jgi:hypothetical protein